MIGWNFPLNNYGQESGLHDAGIETFKGNPWWSLGRETIQNSLDARLVEAGRPVEVHFRLYTLPLHDLPGNETLISALKSCTEYWRNCHKTKGVFDKALSVTGQPTVSVLKISDFNTTGLTGSDQNFGTDWHRLIKSVGTSDKGGKAGGSFGIGKHAPFACSLLRTVFYGTLDIDGNKAFQGVAKLVTHLDANSKPTQGTGYYGVIEKNRPVTDMSYVNPFFQRSQIGTDLFVFGFNKVADWHSRIIKSVIENFLVAILDGILVVRVENTLINMNTLPGLLDEYINQDPDYLSGKYCDALLSPDTYLFVEDDFEGMGRIELFVLPKKDYPKRVAMVRATGMKIFDKAHFHTPLKFAGVLLAKGDKLNEFLRILEPPSHNSWQPERYEEDEAYAVKTLKKLYSWINKCVRNLQRTGETEELDIEGMSQYLPDDLDEVAPTDLDGEAEGVPSSPREVHVTRRETAAADTLPTAGHEAAVTDEGDERYVPTPGNTNTGQGGSPHTEEHGTSGDGSGGSSPGGDGSTARSPRPVRLRNTRIFCINPDSGTYSVSYEPDTSGNGRLFLRIIGEVGAEPASVRVALVTATGQEIGASSHGEIGPIQFEAKVKNTLLVTLTDSPRCSLEVSGGAD